MSQYGDNVMFLLTDHLGSSSIVTDAQGAKIGEVRYKAWGETRYDSGNVPTKQRFTGQREESELGLIYYGARWYDPSIGRFNQADTIIPQPGNPVGWDRFAYTLNNPVRYNDPSGQIAQRSPKFLTDDPGVWSPTLSSYGVTLDNTFTPDDVDQINKEIKDMAKETSRHNCANNDNCIIVPDFMAFHQLVGDVFISHDGKEGNYCYLAGPGAIACKNGTNNRLASQGFAGTIIHEFGHIIGTNLHDYPENYVEGATIVDSSGNYVSGVEKGTNTYLRTSDGYSCNTVPCMMHPLGWLPGGVTAVEDWADMWLNWVNNGFAQSPAGEARYNWMEVFMDLVVKESNRR